MRADATSAPPPAKGGAEQGADISAAPRAHAVSARRQDHRAVAAEVRRAGSSFYWAMRLMAPERRRALFAVYGFCRAVDDIADEPAPVAEKQQRLAQWRGRLGAVYGGAPETPLDRALADAVARFALARADFDAVIAGMEMDAEGPVVAPDLATLDLYCDRVAAAVGRLCVKIFGEPGDEGAALANHLGRALQLTNIIRDVEEDAKMGRLYLPEPLLAKHAIATRSPPAVARHPALPAVRLALAERALAEFTAAKAALTRCRQGDLRPAVIMMKVYERSFLRMAERRFRPLPAGGLTGRLRRLADRLDKLWIAASYGAMGRLWRASTS